MTKTKQFKVLLATLAIVAATNPRGFTFNIHENAYQTTGYAVAVAATQDSFGPEGFLKAIEYAKKHKIACVGGWLDKATGKYYFDATIIVEDRKAAIALGKKNHQLAIFNLNTKRTIRL